MEAQISGNSSSGLDPEKYPACHFQGPEACEDSGKFANGTSCDCDKASILGFEGYGCSHEVAITVMCVLSSCDYGCGGPVHTLADLIDAAHNVSADNAEVAAALTSAVQQNPVAAREALESCWLGRFL